MLQLSQQVWGELGYHVVMCGRFVLDSKVDELIREFVTVTGEGPEKWTPSWNIRPTENIGVLFESTKGEADPVRRFEPARWSLVPPYSKTLKLKYPTFNARAEGILEKSTWKRPAQSHRAVVLANGYYEWQGEKGSKTPYFIRNPDDSVIGFAGLYSWWPDPSKSPDHDSRWTLTATILTSDAVETLADIHDRNPVILPREWWANWIDSSTVGDQDLVDAAVRLGVHEAGNLVFDRVGPVVGNDPNLVRPI